jgi:hypothetical protein
MHVDRDRLADLLERETPLNLEQFERIHGPAVDRRKVWERVQIWAALRKAFPAASIWRIRAL